MNVRELFQTAEQQRQEWINAHLEFNIEEFKYRYGREPRSDEREILLKQAEGLVGSVKEYVQDIIVDMNVQAAEIIRRGRLKRAHAE